MKVLVVGAGFTGCSLACLLRDRGHDIMIKEKLNHIGGLSYTKKSPNGIFYEPFGARTFHTNIDRVKKFIQHFGKFNNYVHNKGVEINGVVRHFPMSIETIKEMPECDKILKELEERSRKLNYTNFETLMISLFGPTLYRLFIYNYSKKMWGIEPRELRAKWVSKRIELRESNSRLFKDTLQGLPIGGYTKLLKKIISGIPIEYNRDYFKTSNYDLVLFSGKIDELYKYKHGILPYRSLCFDYREDDRWENEKYGTINLPQHNRYIRKANFKILYQNNTKHSWIQYQEPIPADSVNLPMYPINTKENNKLFNKYLKEACKSNKVIPVGRLGLYKYLDMDKAISLSIDMMQLIDNWKNLTPEKRYLKIEALLNKY